MKLLFYKQEACDGTDLLTDCISPLESTTIRAQSPGLDPPNSHITWGRLLMSTIFFPFSVGDSDDLWAEKKCEQSSEPA